MKYGKIATKQRKQSFISALVSTMGIVTTASVSCGISRRTHYDWMDLDPEYRQAVEDVAEIALDFAESALHAQIKDGLTTATIFYLKTKGRKRGFIEKVEQHHINKNETDVKIEGGGIPEWLEIPEHVRLEQNNKKEDNEQS